MIGSPVRVLLSVICSSQDGERVAELPVEVRGCSVSPKGRWKSLGKAKGIYFTCDSVYDQRYVVVPSSLPSLEEVDQFGRRILSLSSGSLSGEITRRLDDFLLLYCGQGHPSPLVSALSSASNNADQSSADFQTQHCESLASMGSSPMEL